MNVLGDESDLAFVDQEFRGGNSTKFFSCLEHIAPKAGLVEDFSKKALPSMGYHARDHLFVSRCGSVHQIARWSGVGVTVISNKDSVGMADVSRAIEMLYQWEHKRQGRMASAYAVYFVESNFSNKNLSAVNALLLSASPERLTEWSMVALLRASFSARASLPAWSSFMTAVREKLKDNERLEKMLVGLNR